MDTGKLLVILLVAAGAGYYFFFMKRGGGPYAREFGLAAGEEVKLLFGGWTVPQPSGKAAFAEAERMSLSIRNHRFKSLKNKKGLTVSIGISSPPHPKIKTHDELISLADDALFEAKKSGRDKVMMYKE